MAKAGVLVIHNRYLQPGGEDAVVSAETDLLRRNGHRVLLYTRHNREIAQFGTVKQMLLPLTASWNHESYSELRRLIRQERPAIAHCHNLLPLLSPAAYYACAAEGVPVVQTLHNYRLVCPGGNLFRNASVCNECNDHGLTRSMVHGCYRHSRSQTAAVAFMLGAHGAVGTWREKVQTYIAPSEFCHNVLTKSGLPVDRIVVKPHFVADVPRHSDGLGRYAIFVGRLSEEKGIIELLQLWQGLTSIPLFVVGSGPLEGTARRLVSDSQANHVVFAGQLSRAEALERLRDARFLIAPSRCYETFGMAVLDAAACGVPAIVPRPGALAELVAHHRTGFVVDMNDKEKLRSTIVHAWCHPLETREMGRAACAQCLECYSPDANYKKLIAIYDAALEATHSASHSEPIPNAPAVIAPTRALTTSAFDSMTAGLNS
jgi:glycosyltransferase involved in cell wall biosynthesis